MIERCLTQLTRTSEAVRIVVACNGCIDGTPEIARSFAGQGVEVIELPTSSKSAALNAAELLNLGFPRLYVDADVVPSPRAVTDVIQTLKRGPWLAARPPIRYETGRASPGVRAFYRARSRTEHLMSALWGAGFYAVSEAGRSRWGVFPRGVPDDLFIDAQFERHEVGILKTAPVIVRTPRTMPALLHTLHRVYREPAGETAGLPPRTPRSSARAVLRSNGGGMHSAIDAAAYLAIAAAARLSSRPSHEARWERDNTSRDEVGQCT